MYALGIDLGTTYTAAASWRAGRTEVVPLGTRASSIPSVVLLREDETFLAGETASRRGQTEPHRVAREFKRRLGDTTPILLGGVPNSADGLMAKLLAFVVREVSAREGEAPAAVCVSHPANWGPYKLDLLGQAVRQAGLEQPVLFTSEPEAAAVFYARQQRIAPGTIVAVYDLGGGTFDTAVLRKTETGFEILGRPEGIERLGGIDFDSAVFNHVAQAIGGKLSELDEDDPTALAAVARLKDECVQAKEALSADTDVSIPVLLPNLSTEVRLTRAEFEAMIRPTLYSTIEALNRALRSANVSPEQVHSVLLVGGSSRIPLVAQLVGAELNRPVAVDAHPKNAVALGAAQLASQALPAPAGQGPTVPGPAAHQQTAAFSQHPGPAPQQTAAFARQQASAPVPQRAAATVPVTAARTPPVPPAKPPAARRRKGLLVGAAAAVVLLLAAGGVALAMNNKEKPDTKLSSGSGQDGTPDPDATPTDWDSPGSASTDAAVPADEQCTDEIKSNKRWVCLTKATFDGETFTVEYEADFAGTEPNVKGGYHLHIYGSDGTDPADSVMGAHATDRGKWYIEDQNPSVRTASEFYDWIGDEPKVCARIANAKHELMPDHHENYRTGNCVPIERS